MNKQLKPIPPFSNEEEEQAFWESYDSTDYLDWRALLNKSVFQHSSWLYGIILGLLLHPQ